MKKPREPRTDSYVVLGGKPRVLPNALIEWAIGPDTGISSMTLFKTYINAPMCHGEPDAPHDTSDFGRCYRLLKAFPGVRRALPIVAKRYPEWRELVTHWDELTAIYERDLPTGRSDELFDLIRKYRSQP